MLKKKFIAFILTLTIIMSMLLPMNPIMAATGDPGKIEAESYSTMSGIQTEICSEGGLNVAYTDIDDWMDYTVNVQSTGTYTAEFRVSSPYADTQLQLLTGTTVLATVTVPQTGGWQTWQTVSASINLSAVSQTLRVKAVTNGWNFNWMNITSVTPIQQVVAPTFTPVAGTYTTAQNVTLTCETSGATIKYTTDGSTPTVASATYTGAINIAATTTLKAIATKSGMNDSAIATAAYVINIPTGGKAVPGNIEAESYDTMLGIATEVCSEGGQDVGWIETGDFMNFNVSVATAGTYTVQYRVSTPNTTGVIQLKNGATVLATNTLANTGGWQTWTTVTASAELNAGNQVLTVYASTGGFNVNWINFILDAPVTAVDIPVTGPYAQYLEVGISPADLNGVSTLKSQNTNVNKTVKYDVGTSVTMSVNYMVEQKQVSFRTTDQNGNQIQGNPLTFTVHPNSVVNVDITGSITVATPTFMPNAGAYPSPQNVTMVCGTSGATIKYTTDGSTPTSASPTYTGAISVAATATIKAIAIMSGMNDSAVATAVYTIGSATTNLALNKTATSSSNLGGSTAGAAFDGNTATRWESEFSDPQWIYVDLGENKTVGGVKLNWETASAKGYKIQISTDATNWSDVYTQTNGAGNIEDITFAPVTAKYVRMYGTVRNTAYGYSLWEFEVYGQSAPPLPKVVVPTFTPTPGTYTSAQSVTINCETAGATIRYTTDGSTPTSASAAYTGPINISLTSVVKAIATKSDMTNSDVASAAYTIAALNVLSPVNGHMITNTRTPILTWEAKAGTARYEVWVNLSRTDYDWNATGNLLDRYTKVAEVAGTSCVTPSLVDRWTYKWYVVAVDGNGNKSQSSIGQFSVYLPYIEQVDDGVNIINGSRDLNKNGSIQTYEDWHNPISIRLDDLMSRMSNEEKINQLFYSPDVIDGLNILGGFVFSYGTTDFISSAQKKVATSQPLGIPIAFAGDKVHGWKTIYPTELGLSATRNLNLTWQCGDLQRREQKAWGFTGTLSPIAEVNTKVLYPRFQEGTGENADYSAAMMRAMICGMQGGPEVNPKSIMITVKHWPSQGAGGEQPNVYDSTTIKWHMKTWYAAMDANMATVMPGYGSAPYLDSTGEGACTSKPTIDYLRDVIGFKGVVVTDWLASATDVSVKSIGAGCDVMGGAMASGTDFNALISSVGWTRLNEAVRRVLELKLRLGLFENPYGDPDYPTTIWHSAESNNIVNEAARQSLTLLTNNGILPLKVNNGDTLVVAGPRATSDDMATDNIANVIWQSIYHDNPQAKTYYQGIKDRAGTGINVVLDDATAAKAAVVVIGEKSYTHGTEWLDKQITIPADQIAQIDKFYNRGIPVIAVVVMPRPYILTDILSKCAAVVVVYRPGNGGGLATSQLIFGDYLPKGKLPFQLPRSVDQVGTDVVTNQLEKWDLPYDIGATDAQRTEIRNYINNNQVVPTTYGNPLFPYGYGLQNFTPSP